MNKETKNYLFLPKAKRDNDKRHQTVVMRSVTFNANGRILDVKYNRLEWTLV